MPPVSSLFLNSISVWAPQNYGTWPAGRYSHDLLAHLQEGLSDHVWEGLRDDCEKQGAALLGDLAAGVFARVNESLTELETSESDHGSRARTNGLTLTGQHCDSFFDADCKFFACLNT